MARRQVRESHGISRPWSAGARSRCAWISAHGRQSPGRYRSQTVLRAAGLQRAPQSAALPSPHVPSHALSHGAAACKAPVTDMACTRGCSPVGAPPISHQLSVRKARCIDATARHARPGWRCVQHATGPSLRARAGCVKSRSILKHFEYSMPLCDGQSCWEATILSPSSVPVWTAVAAMPRRAMTSAQVYAHSPPSCHCCQHQHHAIFVRNPQWRRRPAHFYLTNRRH